MSALISVEVAYALADKQKIIALEVPEGTAAEQAVWDSGIASLFPDMDIEAADLGIFGKKIKRDQALKSGDRVEIYRPLIADPKEVRRQRAKQGLQTKKGGGKPDSGDAAKA